MNTALWKKAFGEAKWLLLFCAVGLFLFAWLRIWLVSQVEMSRFAEIIGQLWSDLEKFSLVPLAHLLTYPGRIAVFYNEPMVLLLMSIWAVARGSDVVSGEIGRGTMEMVLSQPISRFQVMTSQAAVGIVGVILLTAAAWLGTAAGIATFHVQEAPPSPSIRIPGLGIEVPLPFLAPSDPEPIRTPLFEKVRPTALSPASLNLASLGFFLLAMSTMISAFDRYRWRTIGIAATIWVVMSVVKIVGMAVEDVAWLQYFSFFTPYSPEWAVYVGVRDPDDLWALKMMPGPGERQFLAPMANNLILLGLGVVCYAVAGVAFWKRDLPAPL